MHSSCINVIIIYIFAQTDNKYNVKIMSLQLFNVLLQSTEESTRADA